MQQQVEHSITRLNDISRIILEELQTEAPRMDFIKNEFENRKEYLHILGVIQQKHAQAPGTINLDAFKVVRPLFDTFISLNDEIKTKMAALKDQQFEKVASARKQRKVQESYVVSRTPNISYF